MFSKVGPKPSPVIAGPKPIEEIIEPNPWIGEDLLLIMESGPKMPASPDATAAYRAPSKKRKERLSIMWPKVLWFSLFVNRISRSSTSLQSSELSGQSFSPLFRSDQPISASCSWIPTWHILPPWEQSWKFREGFSCLSYHWLGWSSISGNWPHNRLFAKPATYCVPRNVNSTLNPNSSHII